MEFMLACVTDSSNLVLDKQKIADFIIDLFTKNGIENSTKLILIEYFNAICFQLSSSIEVSRPTKNRRK
jgi:hypothetical protein